MFGESVRRKLYNGLVDYWPIAETLTASLTGKHDLTNNNTVAAAAGLGARAGQFDIASARYLSRASEADLKTGDIDFTFAPTFMLDAIGVNANIIGKDIDSPASNRDYDMDVTTNNNIRFYINGGGGGLIASTANNYLVAGKWYTAFGWHDARNDLLGLQINNDTPILVATGGAVPQATDGCEFRIGARQYAGFLGYWGGRIQGVGMWKRLLSNQERMYIFGNGLGRRLF